jgi:hypothetical protein
VGRVRPIREGQTYGTIRQLAHRYGMGEGTLRGMVARGELVGFRPPGGWTVYEFAEVERALRLHRVRLPASVEAHIEDRVNRMVEQEFEKERRRNAD